MDDLVNEIYFSSPADSQPQTQPPQLQRISANQQPNQNSDRMTQSNQHSDRMPQQMPPSNLQHQKATVLVTNSQPAAKSSKSMSNYIPKFAQTTAKIKEFYNLHRVKVIVMMIVLMFIIIIYGSYKTNGGLYKKLSGITILSKILPKKETLALPPPTTANMNPTTPAPPQLLPPPPPTPPPAADKQESEEGDGETASDKEEPSQQPAPVTKSPPKKAAAAKPAKSTAPTKGGKESNDGESASSLPPPKKKKRAQSASLIPAKRPVPEAAPKRQFLTNKEILESETEKKKLPPGEDSDAYYE